MASHDDRMVTVFVGRAERKWELRESDLIRMSDFFRAAFRSSFQESQDSILRLPEDDPRAFELFVDYANARSEMNPSTASWGVLRYIDGYLITVRDYLGLYIFAAKYLVEPLKRKLIDLIHSWYAWDRNEVDPLDAEFVYERTPENCSLRRLLRMWYLVKMFHYESDGSQEWRYSLRHRSQFGRDIVSMICQLPIIPKEMSLQKPDGKCAFHTHLPDDDCPYINGPPRDFLMSPIRVDAGSIRRWSWTAPWKWEHA